jgi:uncharacterized protein (TIGR03000 family)
MRRITFTLPGTLLGASLAFLAPGAALALPPLGALGGPNPPLGLPAFSVPPPVLRSSSWSGYGAYYGGTGYYPYYLNSYPPYLPSAHAASDSLFGLTTEARHSRPAHQPSSASPVAPALHSPAHITVTVPADATVSFDGKTMTSTGRGREFVTPPLTPGWQYTCRVVARWNENGQSITQVQPLDVTAGGNFEVRFPVPTKPGG